MAIEGGLEHQPMRLAHFLKLCGIAGTGGHAKVLIQGGEIQLNGELETRRRRKLTSGDVIAFDGKDYPLNDFVPDQ
jgi:ribosome-associated protein